mgnify:CR=1 FL=1
MQRRALLTLSLTAALAAVPLAAGAQPAWPTQPVRIVVPAPARS